MVTGHIYGPFPPHLLMQYKWLWILNGDIAKWKNCIHILIIICQRT